MARDPRLQDGLKRTKLVQLISDARPHIVEAMMIGSRVPVDSARINQTLASTAWESVILEADALGRFDQLLEILIQDLGDSLAAGELSTWERSIPFKNLQAAAQEVRSLLETITSVQNPATVEFELGRLSQFLARMTRTLSAPDAAEEAFGGLRDSAQQARRARDAARQASASADSLVYQVHNATDFLSREPMGSNPRDVTDFLTAQGLLVRQLLQERSDLDRSVTSLLETLHGMLPAPSDESTSE